MLKPQKARFQLRAGISPNEMIHENSVSLTSPVFTANYLDLHFAFGFFMWTDKNREEK